MSTETERINAVKDLIAKGIESAVAAAMKGNSEAPPTKGDVAEITAVIDVSFDKQTIGNDDDGNETVLVPKVHVSASVAFSELV